MLEILSADANVRSLPSVASRCLDAAGTTLPGYERETEILFGYVYVYVHAYVYVSLYVYAHAYAYAYVYVYVYVYAYVYA